MSFFRKLIGKKQPVTASTLTLPPASSLPAGAPEMMKVWDAYGRMMEISREDWRNKILPGNFRDAWNNADQLSNLIGATLKDGFIADSLEPARQLHRIDHQPKRGALYLAVVLLQLKQFDEAEKIIIESMRKHGEEGTLLTNLAKAYSGKGNTTLAEETLWRALELDPNQDNGFAWYQAIHREHGGDQAGLEAMQRVAALPGSWRPQLWLAREALKLRDSDRAFALYNESLSRVSKPIPTDLLMQISGDLGNAGHLPEILRLVEPYFEPSIHGLQVGNNLIKAHFDLGQIDSARSLLDQLYAQKRPDWKEHLSFWDTELAKARIALNQPEKPESLKSALLTINGPIWLAPSSLAANLFGVKAGERVNVGFLGCTAEIATNSKRVQAQMTDAPGRMSRSLPLYLAEQVEFGSSAKVQTLAHWIIGDSPGFIVTGVAWTDEAAANYARQGELKNDYVVITHVMPNQEPWRVDLRLVRTIDAKCLGAVTTSFPAAKPEDGIPVLAKQLLELVREQAEVELTPNPPLYLVPTGSQFRIYLLRLEQLLAVRCAGMDGVPSKFLGGEREIIDGNLRLCLDHPQNIGTRILLAQTLCAMKLARPDVLPEFAEKIERLQKEKPLSEPAHGIVQQIINEALLVK